jgi:lysophospholipase L1-like esterase
MDYPRGAVLKYNEPWLEYVALGDSFSSGEGVEPYQSGTDVNGMNECHRSLLSYPKRLDANSNFRLDLTAFKACSGAETHNIPVTNTGQWNEAPQASGLSANTDVVTISIGGNDSGFSAFVTKCLFLDCSQSAVKDSYFDAIEDELGDKLESAYDEILTQAPNAHVYVIGYPQLLPTDGCPQTNSWMETFDLLVASAHNDDNESIAMVYFIGQRAGLTPSEISAFISAGEFEFNAGETTTGRLLVQAINEKSKEVISDVGVSRLMYIDPLRGGSPFAGHELCTSAPYFNGLVIGDPEHSFHPNVQGHTAYAQLLTASF